MRVWLRADRWYPRVPLPQQQAWLAPNSPLRLPMERNAIGLGYLIGSGVILVARCRGKVERILSYKRIVKKEQDLWSNGCVGPLTSNQSQLGKVKNFQSVGHDPTFQRWAQIVWQLTLASSNRSIRNATLLMTIPVT